MRLPRKISRRRADYLPFLPVRGGRNLGRSRPHPRGEAADPRVCLGHRADRFSPLARGLIRPRGLCTARCPASDMTERIYQGLENLRNTISLTRDTPKGLPSCLKVTATSEDGEIMGSQAREVAIEGVRPPRIHLDNEWEDLRRTSWMHTPPGRGCPGQSPQEE